MSDSLSYKKAGVDISAADAAKREMAQSVEAADPRVLNKLGAFATLFDARFEGYEHPVLVLKTEEPGSKQLLAFRFGRVESICYDMINHLINDIIVMGARPLSVQDAVICGKLKKNVVTRIVAALAAACREQGCTLTGGETSEQPGVIPVGTYILTSSVVGVVEKSKIIDGSQIEIGDAAIAVASNGLHTNGYSLVRALMDEKPKILKAEVAGESFIDAILKPHTCYFRAFEGLFDMGLVHGLAHITGGGIEGNLNRILPEGVNARVDRSLIRILPIFNLIKRMGAVPDADMLRTFNMGVGMTIVAKSGAVDTIRKHLADKGHESYHVGEIVRGEKKVEYVDGLKWPKAE